MIIAVITGSAISCIVLGGGNFVGLSTSTMQEIAEPVITAMIITSEDSVGAILQLCEEKRGVQKNFEYLSPQRVMLTYELPLNEIVLDFYDRLKSVSRGYASLDYHLSGYK